MADEIDLDRFVAELSEEDVRRDYKDVLSKLSALTNAIKYRHPLIMGKGDETIPTAMRLIMRCRCE